MLLKKLEEVENRFLKLEESLSDSEIHKNPSAYQKLAKEHSGSGPSNGQVSRATNPFPINYQKIKSSWKIPIRKCGNWPKTKLKH